MILREVLFLAGGILLLNVGANWLVYGSANLARGLGIRPMLIGMTVVAFGTSAPEFVVSLIAALKHQIGISFGNIVGSNIANIGLILGISAVIRPLKVSSNILKEELPILTVATLLLLVFCFNGYFSPTEGMIFVLAAIGFIGYTIYSGAKDKGEYPAYEKEIPTAPPRPLRDSLLTLLGLGTLLGGSHLVVESGVGLMRAFGVSETVIGLTVIAVGTSLPELATSIVSALKGEGDICIGNVIGSNIFNTLFILGGVSLLGSIDFSAELRLIRFQTLLLAGLTLFLFPILRSDREVNKVEGGILLVVYTGFIMSIIYAPLLKF